MVVIQRTDCCGEKFHYIQIQVGFHDHSSHEKNQLCAMFEGPAETGAIDAILCEHPVEGNKAVLTSGTERIEYGPIALEEVILMGMRVSMTSVYTTTTAPATGTISMQSEQSTTTSFANATGTATGK